jgi:hypothetical protein
MEFKEKNVVKPEERNSYLYDYLTPFRIDHLKNFKERFTTGKISMFVRDPTTRALPLAHKS